MLEVVPVVLLLDSDMAQMWFGLAVLYYMQLQQQKISVQRYNEMDCTLLCSSHIMMIAIVSHLFSKTVNRNQRGGILYYNAYNAKLKTLRMVLVFLRLKPCRLLEDKSR